jgi:protein MAK11
MSTIGVAAASYEGSLFSWKGNRTSLDEEQATSCDLTMTSGFHCCAGSIRSLSTSASGRYMACGGTDERIHIFNMLENSTLGELSTHTGAVTCLDFFEDSFLLSGSDVSRRHSISSRIFSLSNFTICYFNILSNLSIFICLTVCPVCLFVSMQDNSICIWRTDDWMCVHILGGHKGSINSVSIHPSGKLAVSVAQDNTLKVWNLVQGKTICVMLCYGGSGSATSASDDASVGENTGSTASSIM